MIVWKAPSINQVTFEPFWTYVLSPGPLESSRRMDAAAARWRFWEIETLGM